MEQEVLKNSIEVINSPLDLIDHWDFAIVILSGFVRLLFAARVKSMELEEKNKRFSFAKYFDGQHSIRWISHLATGIALLLVIPEIFILFVAPKYLPDFSTWSFTADFIIGFLGYDLIKLLEKITKPYIDKFLKHDKLKGNN